MVECEPACPCRFRKGREPFVNRVPVSKAFQTCWTTLPEGLVQMEEPLIVDIIVEVHVDFRGLVREQKPAYLGNREPISLCVNKHGPYAQPGFQKAFDSVSGKS